MVSYTVEVNLVTEHHFWSLYCILSNCFQRAYIFVSLRCLVLVSHLCICVFKVLFQSSVIKSVFSSIRRHRPSIYRPTLMDDVVEWMRKPIASEQHETESCREFFLRPAQSLTLSNEEGRPYHQNSLGQPDISLSLFLLCPLFFYFDFITYIQ